MDTEYDVALPTDDVDAQIESEQRLRRKRLKAENDALDAKIKDVDLKAWFAQNTGAAHAPVLSPDANMTPIDTRPIDPYLGVGHITEIMRRSKDESVVSSEGKSLPSGGGGSSNGGGVAKPMPKTKKKNIPLEAEAPVRPFTIKNLTPGERHFCAIAGTDVIRDILLHHIAGILAGQVDFVPHSRAKNLGPRTCVNVYGLSDVALDTLRLHRGSARRVIVTYLHDKYGHRIREIDQNLEPDIAA